MIKSSFLRITLVAIIALAPSLIIAQAPDFPENMIASSTGQRGQEKDPSLIRISVDFSAVPLEQALKTIANKVGLKLTYPTAGLPKKAVTASMDSVTYSEAFAKVLDGTGLRVQMVGTTHAAVVERKFKVDTTEQRDGQGQIVGKVIDSVTRQGINGVTIVAVGTNISTVTQKDGSFRMAKLQIGKRGISARILGYTSTQVEVTVIEDRENQVVIALAASATSLNEVVTTAGGQQKRLEVGNDIVKINAEEIRQRAPIRSVTDMLLHAQVPGVLVTPSSGEPGAPARVRIRGIGSISQSNDPVVIVDGVWIDNSSGNRLANIDNIDPANIETVEIVKGPSAATLYGQDASNGVIIITTKKGRAGDTRWNMTFSRDYGAAPGKKPVQYRGYGRDIVSDAFTSCVINNVVDFRCIQDSVVVFDPNHPLLVSEGNSLVDRFHTSVDGGSNVLRYAISGTFQEDRGARRLPGVELIRMRRLKYPVPGSLRHPSQLSAKSIMANMSLSPTERLDLTLGFSGSGRSLTDNMVSNAYNGSSHYSPPLDTIGFLNTEVSIREVEKPRESFSNLLSFQSLWRGNDWWNINLVAGLERTNEELTETYFGANCVNLICNPATGRIRISQRAGQVQSLRMQSTFVPSFKVINRFIQLKPGVGFDIRRTQSSNLFAERLNIPPGERTFVGGTAGGMSYDKTKNITGGWYINTNIGLLHRIYFDLGLRQDVGSAIKKTAGANYPKLATSWLISDESFWPRNKFVEVLRLRAALGHAAVQPDEGDIYGRYTGTQAYVNNQIVHAAIFSGFGNSALKPERAVELEFGFDVETFDDRASFGFTFAHKENRNNIVQKGMPPSAGGIVGTRKENIAKVVNQSLELNASIRVIDIPGLFWNLDANMGMLHNRVDDLGQGVFGPSSGDFRVVKGYPIGGYWAKPVMGFYDADNDGLLADSEVILGDTSKYIGWGQPRINLSFGTAFAVGPFRLDSRFAYKGNYVQSLGLSPGYGSVDVNAPLSEQAMEKSTRLSAGRPISDLRWNSASIAYALPVSYLKKMRARTLSVALQGSNLGLWTKYLGRDPGVNTSLYSEGMQDNLTVLPPLRKYVLSISLGF